MLYINTVLWDGENDTDMQKQLQKWGYARMMRIIGDWVGISSYGYVIVQDVKNIEVHTNKTIHWRPVCVFGSLHLKVAS